MKFKAKIQGVWELHGGKETMASFDVEFASGIPEHYINWMRGLKHYIELEDYYWCMPALTSK